MPKQGSTILELGEVERQHHVTGTDWWQESKHQLAQRQKKGKKKVK
jgi:hypothetical protein